MLPRTASQESGTKYDTLETKCGQFDAYSRSRLSSGRAEAEGASTLKRLSSRSQSRFVMIFASWADQFSSNGSVISIDLSMSGKKSCSSSVA